MSTTTRICGVGWSFGSQAVPTIFMAAEAVEMQGVKKDQINLKVKIDLHGREAARKLEVMYSDLSSRQGVGAQVGRMFISR